MDSFSKQVAEHDGITTTQQIKVIQAYRTYKKSLKFWRWNPIALLMIAIAFLRELNQIED